MTARLLPDIAADEDRVRDVTDQLLAVADGLTADALANPESYPPDRQLALLRAAVAARW